MTRFWKFVAAWLSCVGTTRPARGAAHAGRLLLALAMVMLAHAAAAQPAARTAVDSVRTVTLPLAEYNRLLDLANRPAGDPAAAPVPATLAAADLQIRVDDDAARGVFEVTGTVLRNGIQRVPLLAGATLIDAATPAGPLPLVAEGGVHSALLPGPGPFALTLEWGAPLAFTPGRAAFTLPVPPSGTARATFDLPGEGADVRLSPGVITRRTAAAGRTLVEATLEPGAPAEVSWSMRDRATVAAAREVRALADVFTLVTIGESDVRMIALVELTVVLGQPASVDLQLPQGYELVSLHGASFDTSVERDGVVTLSLTDPGARRHQFVVGLEQRHDAGSFSMESGLLTLPSVQRERGEIAIEGTATLELRAADREGLHRIDVRELNPSLQALAGGPILSAFRYQAAPGAPPAIALDVTRFGDVGVLAAAADRATVTTLVSTDGRSLTEIVLQVQNRAQPFLKVALPPGASIVSVEVAGQPAKPALGADGTRVPLLRPGFRPQGSYAVSFVYLDDGMPFERKGDWRMALPVLDIPIGIVEWEVFVPDRYRVRSTGGNVIARTAFPGLIDSRLAFGDPSHMKVSTGPVDASRNPAALGTISGRVTDVSGGALPGVAVTLSSPVLEEKVRAAVTDSTGAFSVTALPPGIYTVTHGLQGFLSLRRENVLVTGGATTTIASTMHLGGVTETVRVVGEAPVVDVQSARQVTTFSGEGVRDMAAVRKPPALLALTPSQNVVDLQTRAAGVLPVRVDVPRAGTSHKFIRPLVVQDETVVRLRYSRR